MLKNTRLVKRGIPYFKAQSGNFLIFRTNLRFSPIHLSAAFPNELSFPSSESSHASAVVKKEQASREKYCRQKFWNELGSLPLPLFLLESQVESEDGHPGGEEEGEQGEEDHHQHHPRHPGTKEIRRTIGSKRIQTRRRERPSSTLLRALQGRRRPRRGRPTRWLDSCAVRRQHCPNIWAKKHTKNIRDVP